MADDATAARAEWRAEEEQWSRAAFEHWEHRRRLDDVLRDCMHRRDVVTFEFPTVTWAGRVVAVGRDVVRIGAGATRVDVRLTTDAPFVLRARPGADDGHVGEAIGTFSARLRELDGTAVCIGTSSGALEGELRVGHDQLRIVTGDGGAAYVPTGSVCWMRPLDAD